MAKTITATAVISAKDDTGATFDKVANKMKSIEKAAKAFSGIKAPTFVGDFSAQLEKLHASAREMQTIQKSWANFDKVLKSNGPMRASKYLEAVDLWKSNTLGALREVRAGMDQHEEHQKRFYSRLRNTAAGAAGLIGGAYLAERAGKGAIKSAAERSREMARYSLSGMTDDEKVRANAKADEIAGRNPTVSRTDILGHIRQLKGRLGSFDHAIDNVETITNAQTVLGTLGHGGEEGAADLERLSTALESQGVAANPDKFRTYMNAFVRAKSVFGDLTGDKFQQYMQASNSSKYGVSEDYLATVAPTMMQHNRAPNFGVEQASAFSALIGGRQSEKAKAAMRAAGLLDKDDRLLHEKAFVSNPYEWARTDLKSALAGQGIKMDEEHRGDLVTAMTRMFSNRKVADFFTSLLVNEGVIEKDKAQIKLAKGTEGAASARNEDGFQAAQAINTQLKDAAAALLNISPVVKLLNAVAEKMSAATNKFDQGTTADKTGMVIGGTLLGGGAAAAAIKGASMAYQWFTGTAALTGAATALDASAAALSAAAAELAGGKALPDVAKKLAPGGAAAAAGAGGGALSNIWRFGAAAAPYAMGAFGVGMAGGALWDMVNQPGYSGLDLNSPLLEKQRGGSVRDALRRAFNQDRRRLNIPDMGNDFGAPEVTPTMTYGTGMGDKAVVVSGSVTGQGEFTIKIEAPEVLSVVQQAKAMMQLAGQINSNGPGSAGVSSPDAASPPRPSPGYGGPGF